ncbi:MAG: DUF4432 family protein [Eubacteriales bacterium]|nr:DUF4432 family protein [Eubacteriales bacterium]
MNTKIALRKEAFPEWPFPLMEAGCFRATAFRYATGVCALEVTNGLCSFLLLPFQGQQLWRVRFGGEDFTMRSIFDEPEPTTVFDLTYGAFLIHCGLTAMGNPSEEDDHPLHGELPNAEYRQAYLETGDDGGKRYVRVSGTYHHRNGLETNYLYTPSIRLYEGETILRAENRIENLRSQPFSFMYMAHINWLPREGARLVYSAQKDPEHREVFPGDFGDGISQERAARLSEYTKRLIADPDIGDVLDSKRQCYDPELCSCMRYRADDKGWAHAMQIMPDGRSCYVRFETEYLPNALRWIARTGDEDALGFALPTTGNHLGRAYAIRNHLRREIPPHEGITLKYDFGVLTKKETAEAEDRIRKILAK